MHFKHRVSAALKAFANPHLIDSPQPGRSGRKSRKEDNLRDLGIINRQRVEGTQWKSATPRWQRVRDISLKALEDAGLQSGKMLEIGGRRNPRNEAFPAFHYEALDLEGAPADKVAVMAGDISNCPHIPDESYDFIFSFDVFEHIEKPWLAASEITRLLRPGGVTVHSTLFAWRYHPCPVDYWRFSAEGLKSLFSDLRCLHSDFDYTERRRDIYGKGRNAVTPDAYGGWRENVRVNYAGMKT